MKTIAALSLALLLSAPALCAPSDSSTETNVFTSGSTARPGETSYHLSGGALNDRLKAELVPSSSTEVLPPTYRNSAYINDLKVDNWNYATYPWMRVTSVTPLAQQAYGGQDQAVVEPTSLGEPVFPYAGFGVMISTDGDLFTW